MTRCQTDRMHNVLSAACANQPRAEDALPGWVTAKRRVEAFLTFGCNGRGGRGGRGVVFYVVSAMLAKTAKSMEREPCRQVRFRARALNN